LYRVVAAEFPFQITAIDKLAQPRVERHNVVVFQIDLDEGFPVVMTFMPLDTM